LPGLIIGVIGQRRLPLIQRIAHGLGNGLNSVFPRRDNPRQSRADQTQGWQNGAGGDAGGDNGAQALSDHGHPYCW
jgi:hypothetical protein